MKLTKFSIITFYLIFQISLSIYGQKNQLHFRDNGDFKIVQFTDMHLEDTVAGIVFKLVDEIIDIEKPDLVIITGDVTFQPRVDALLTKLAAVFADNKVYWTAVLGNHDAESESGPSRQEVSDLIRSLPYNMNGCVKGIKGATNFILPVAGKTNNGEALLYFFDSNSYNKLKNRVQGYYDWIDISQINWYLRESTSHTKRNGGIPVPSLAFFHIPFPEYGTLWEQDSLLCIGSKHEEVSCPQVNSGLCTSMLECGDIMGVFTGHDHVNDYIGCYNGLALAYGRFSGTFNIYGFLTPGARVIVLKEGKREFETWIREKGGNKVYDCQYPESFKSDDN